VRCTDDQAEGRIVWANGVSVKIKWDDGEQVTWRRDSLAGGPIEILTGDEDQAATTGSSASSPRSASAVWTPYATPEPDPRHRGDSFDRRGETTHPGDRRRHPRGRGRQRRGFVMQVVSVRAENAYVCECCRRGRGWRGRRKSGGRIGGVGCIPPLSELELADMRRSVVCGRQYRAAAFAQALRPAPQKEREKEM